MSAYKSTISMRAFYLFAATVLWLGIWDTGFSIASWVLYVPAVTFVFAATTGFCPSQILFGRLLAGREREAVRCTSENSAQSCTQQKPAA